MTHRTQLHHFTRRLRRRSKPDERDAAGRRRRRTARMASQHAVLHENDRSRRRDYRHRQQFRRTRDGEHRCIHNGAKHVRSGARPVARRFMARMVGHQPALSHANVCAHASRARCAGNGRWHCLSFCYYGIHAALDSARSAARGKDIRLLAGVATVRQYL